MRNPTCEGGAHHRCAGLVLCESIVPTADVEDACRCHCHVVGRDTVNARRAATTEGETT